MMDPFLVCFYSLVAVVIGFFICWAPFHAQRLLYIYAKDSPNYREINEKMFFITGHIALAILPLLCVA